MTLRLLTISLASVVLLTSCSSTNKIKRGGLAPEVDEKFAPKGHLEGFSEKQKLAPPKSSIPKIAQLNPFTIQPQRKKDNRKYSVSAIKVPVSDVLFRLASDAKKNLSLDSSVTGLVTVNSLNQSLDSILKRITEQVDAIYEVSGNQIKIKPNLPFWQTYKVNYVNLKKKSSDSIVLKMSIGGVSGGSGSNASSNQSQSKVEMLSEHDFWSALKKNVEALATYKVEKKKVVTVLNQQTQENKQGTQNTTASEASKDSQTIEEEKMETVVINPESGLISVFSIQRQQDLIADYLDQVLERSNKQVLIEATVVEVQLSDEYQAGIDWSFVDTNTSVSQVSKGANFSGNLEQFNLKFLSDDGKGTFGITALQKFGDTKVLSSPRIMTVSNQTALLKVVDNQVYFTIEVSREAATATSAGFTTYETTVHTVPVGFMMSLTPFVTDNDDISINVRPTLSRIIGYATDPNPALRGAGANGDDIKSEIPIIREREMSSVLKLRDKQTAVIGGLIQDSHSNTRKGVPGLMDVPAVGDVFAYRNDDVTKTELVIFIKPTVINNPDVEHGDLTSLKPFLKTRTLNTDN